ILRTAHPAILERDVFALNESNVMEALLKGMNDVCEAGSLRASEKSDPRHRQLLPPRRERPRRNRASNHLDEVAPCHSITLSARAKQGRRQVTPGASAALALVASSH